MERYDAAFDRAIQVILDHPQIGRLMEAVATDLRGYRVEHHVLYYRLRGDTIEVVRILDGRADAALHLGRRGG